MKKYYVYWQGPADSGYETCSNLFSAIKCWWSLRRIAVAITTYKIKEFE